MPSSILAAVILALAVSTHDVRFAALLSFPAFLILTALASAKRSYVSISPSGVEVGGALNRSFRRWSEIHYVDLLYFGRGAPDSLVLRGPPGVKNLGFPLTFDSLPVLSVAVAAAAGEDHPLARKLKWAAQAEGQLWK